MPYIPEPYDGIDVSQYMQNEFERLSRELDPLYDGLMDKRFVVPQKPRNGIYYADGSNWNPGAGVGMYRYDEDDASFHPLGNYIVTHPDEDTAGVTPTNWFYPVGHVRRYGALGDGSTDDQQAFQDAIDVMTINGGKVIVDGGTFVWGSSVEIKSNVDLVGCGWGSIIKLADSAAASLTAIQSGTSPSMLYTDGANASNFSVSKLWFDGNDANNSANTYWQIGIADATDFQVYRCKFTDAYGAGFGAFICEQFEVSHCLFTDITGAPGNNGNGMYIRKCLYWTLDTNIAKDLDNHMVYLSGTTAEPTANGTVDNHVAINTGRDTGSAAFNCLDHIQRVVFNGCFAYDGRIGYSIIGAAEESRDITYNGCVAHSMRGTTSSNGFSTSSSTGASHARVEYNECKAYFSGIGTASSVGYGFNINQCNDLRINECEGSANNYDGVRLNEVDRFTVTGRFNNNGQEPSVTNRAGVRMEDVTEGEIEATAYDNDYGFYIDDAANNIKVSGYYEGNNTAPYFRSTSAVSSVIIRDVPETNSLTVRSRILGEAAPTAGNWSRGDYVENITPDDGDPRGWLNTGGGAPGTWRPYSQVHYRSGAGSPLDSVTPNMVREQYLDTDGDIFWIATTLTSAGWRPLGFPRTAAEIAQSVTPSDYTYAPGHLIRYGGVGDDSTNNHDAIEDALTQAEHAEGAPVYVPQGIFRTDDRHVLTAARSGVRIYGDGYNSVIRLTGAHTTNNKGIFVVEANGDPDGGSVDGADNVTIENLRLDGGLATFTSGEGSGIRCFHGVGHVFKDIWSHDHETSGILLQSEGASAEYSVHLRNCRLYDNTDQGLHVSHESVDAARVTATDLWVYGNTGIGVDVNAGSMTFNNAWIYDNDGGGAVNGSGDNQTVIWNNSHFDENTGATTEGYTTTGTFRLLEFNNCTFDANGDHGMEILHTGVVQGNNMYLRGNGDMGLRVGAQARLLIGTITAESNVNQGLEIASGWFQAAVVRTSDNGDQGLRAATNGLVHIGSLVSVDDATAGATGSAIVINPGSASEGLYLGAVHCADSDTNVSHGC